MLVRDFFMNKNLSSKGVQHTVLAQFSCDTCFVGQLLSHVRSLQPHGLQHARPPCPSSTPRVCSNSCALNHWCHLTILSSAIPFSSCLQSSSASGSFPMSWLFTSGSQSIEASASASVLPMNIQGWFCLGLTSFDLLAVQGTLKSLLQQMITNFKMTGGEKESLNWNPH